MLKLRGGCHINKNEFFDNYDHRLIYGLYASGLLMIKI